MTSLSPCPSCRRHVRDGERCPFCGSEPGAPLASSEVKRGLRRAVVLAATTALAAGGAMDCGSTVETQAGTTTGSTGDGGHGGHGGAVNSVASTASAGGGLVVAASSSTSGTGGAATTSTTGNTGGFLPPYGAPPV
jgi:hypothetical protein